MQHVYWRWGFIHFSGPFQIILVCLELRHIIEKLIYVSVGDMNAVHRPLNIKKRDRFTVYINFRNQNISHDLSSDCFSLPHL